LILVDLTNGPPVCIATFSPEAVSPSAFEEQLGTVMPIIESFKFQAPKP
jgi:hypothetical protein